MAASAPSPRIRSTQPVPIPALAGGWVPMPRRVLERVGPLLSRIERCVLDLIILRTIADDDRGRPEWCTIAEAEFAKFAGATIDGAHRALVRLEHRFGVLNSAPEGKTKRYRVVLAAAEQMPEPTPRRLTRKPPQQETEARIVADRRVPSQGTMEPPDTPRLPDPTETAENSAGSLAARAPGTLEAGLVLEMPLSPRVRSIHLRNATAAAFTIAACSARGRLELTLGEPPSAADLPPGYANQCRAFLQEFVRELHRGPREEDVNALADAGAGRVSIDQLRAYTRKRMRGGLAITGYGIFAKLARDCLDSSDEWAATHAPPARLAASDPRESLARWAAELDRAGPAFAKVAAELHRLAADREPAGLDVALPALQLEMLEAARTVGRSRLPALRQAIAPEVERYRGRMTRDQVADIERNLVDRHLSELLHLPRLELW